VSSVTKVACKILRRPYLLKCDRGRVYTAVLTKVVPEKRKSVRDNARWHYG